MMLCELSGQSSSPRPGRLPRRLVADFGCDGRRLRRRRSSARRGLVRVPDGPRSLSPPTPPNKAVASAASRSPRLRRELAAYGQSDLLAKIGDSRCRRRSPAMEYAGDPGRPRAALEAVRRRSFVPNAPRASTKAIRGLAVVEGLNINCPKQPGRDRCSRQLALPYYKQSADRRLSERGLPACSQASSTIIRSSGRSSSTGN
ncbi:MAG: hypothetical protein MZW92_59540 [Comamonadaceae bacterium]|nr:hypothetical protein [Comamonadaceae bacterium]